MFDFTRLHPCMSLNGSCQFFLHDARNVPHVEEANFVLPCRWFKNASETYIKLPFIGAVSYLTLAVTPFCITFAVFWAVYRDKSFAWIGQDILVRYMFLIILKCFSSPLIKTIAQ